MPIANSRLTELWQYKGHNKCGADVWLNDVLNCAVATVSYVTPVRLSSQNNWDTTRRTCWNLILAMFS